METSRILDNDELDAMYKAINFMKFRSLKHNIKNILEEHLYDVSYSSIRNELSKKIWASRSNTKVFYVKEFSIELDPLVKCHGISLDEVKEEILHEIDIVYISQIRVMFPTAKFNCNFIKDRYTKFKFSIEFKVTV